jgi:hypothetical protein
MSAVTIFPTKRTQEEAAKIIGISVATLARERAKGRITAYTPGERKVYYLDGDIAAYIERRTKCLEKSSSPEESETTGSHDNEVLHSCIEHGSIEALDKRDAKASALKILSGPTRCSRNGSPSTSSCDVPSRET